MTQSGAKVVWEQLLRAEEIGVRSEIVAGLHIWEAQPLFRHQEQVDRIRASIHVRAPADQAGCDCFHIADIYMTLERGCKSIV
ncbi:MAG: hypothetical protein RMN25_10765 [Anaerolineae bacterium]|nr:hypothetical protein [Thermoflexales bacterium]MDW8408248.1 hypothetical protein [Anaerolineae bacterium]